MGRFYKRTIDQPMPVGRTSAQTLARAAVRRLGLFPARRAAAHRQRPRRLHQRARRLSQSPVRQQPLSGRGRAQPGARQSRRADPARGAQHRRQRPARRPRQLRDAVLAQPRRSSRSTCATSGPRSSRLGSDMYIFLARQNVQIYLLGGFLLVADRHLLGRLCELRRGPPHARAAAHPRRRAGRRGAVLPAERASARR